jgi:methanogenic corrinoid protein MtbC1
MDVLQHAMYEVGRLWEGNRISVAEEHMATAITQFVIAQLYQRLSPAANARGRVVITGVQGELHQVGANMVADVLEEMGWDVRFLGSNMPHSGILNVVNEFQPELVGISATMLFNVPQVRTLVREIRDRFPTDPPRIVVGGAAFKTAPKLYKEIGADAFASNLQELKQQLEQT